MMTDVHNTVKRLENSEAFQEFSRSNPHHYLVHAFSTGKEIELGYYGKESDKITVFKTNPVAMLPAEEVFKQQGVLEALNLDMVQLGLHEALERAEAERANAYPQHITTKSICILQQQDGPVWNITLVTATLQMINVKLSAQSGELHSRDMRSIMDLARE
jgi:hypothetical protein